MPVADLSIREASRRLRDGSLTSTALTEAHLERIAALDGDLRAFTLVTAERARSDAARADAELASGLDRGPLHGIPVGLKDLIDVAGLPTRCGSRVRGTQAASEDAAVVTGLAAAGAVLIGKLSLYEFATVGPDFEAAFPPARNPWSFDHITGGSSSGNASAVAAGLLRTSIGSDTAGSLRGPASYCGVVGLKPTMGLVPTSGTFPLAPSLDHLGPISASVEDAALTLDAIARLAPERGAVRALGAGLAGLRIGYARAWFAGDPAAMPEVVAAVDDAVSTLSLLGARIEEIAMPDDRAFLDAGATILNAESYALHREDLETRHDAYGPMSRRSLLTGAGLSPERVAEARRAGLTLREEVDALFARIDAIVTVTTLTTALPISAFAGGKTVWTPMRTIAFNVTGHPVLSLPIGFCRGLPIGMQIAGPHHREDLICRIGHAFEQGSDHATIRPRLTTRSRLDAAA